MSHGSAALLEAAAAGSSLGWAALESVALRSGTVGGLGRALVARSGGGTFGSLLGGGARRAISGKSVDPAVLETLSSGSAPARQQVIEELRKRVTERAAQSHGKFRKKALQPTGPQEVQTGAQEFNKQFAAKAQLKSMDAAQSLMFPWERRQMQGGEAGGLKTWEKTYWVLFGLGAAFLLASNVYRNYLKPLPKEPEMTEEERAAKEAREAEKKRAEEERKTRAAVAISRGQSVLEGEDPFKGWTPEEIEVFVKKTIEERKLTNARNLINAIKADESDPFDGMTPEEIDAFVAKNGYPEGYKP